MVNVNQIIMAASKAEKFYNEVKARAFKVRSDIGSVFSSVDESFVYNTFVRNDIIIPHLSYSYKGNFSFTFPSILGVNSLQIPLRSSEIRKRDNIWPNGRIEIIHASEKASFSHFLYFGLYGDFMSFLMGEDAYRGHDITYALSVGVHEAQVNRIYRYLLARMEYMDKVMTVLNHFERFGIPALAKWLAEQYNHAVSVDKKNDEAFAKWFGDETSRKKISIFVDIKVNEE